MQQSYVSIFFALVASIAYLMIFLFIIHNAVIRLTPLKTPLSKALIATGFLACTGALYTWMGHVGYGSSTYVLPSHLFVLVITWGEFFMGNRQQSN